LTNNIESDPKFEMCSGPSQASGSALMASISNPPQGSSLSPFEGFPNSVVVDATQSSGTRSPSAANPRKDSSKFGRSLFAEIAGLGAADYFITDAPPPADLAAALAENDVQVLFPDQKNA